jgi:hypothetical protein
MGNSAALFSRQQQSTEAATFLDHGPVKLAFAEEREVTNLPANSAAWLAGIQPIYYLQD